MKQEEVVETQPLFFMKTFTESSNCVAAFATISNGITGGILSG